MAGRTVLPGLVMLHEHLMFTEPIGLTRPQDFSFPRLYLAFGVTTMRTAGTDYPYIDLNLKRRLDAGLLPGPEIYITSPYFSGEGDPFSRRHDPQDAPRRPGEAFATGLRRALPGSRHISGSRRGSWLR